MLRKTLFALMAVLAASAGADYEKKKSGIGLHGTVGTDFTGLAFGGGASWVNSYGSFPYGLGLTFLTSSHVTTVKDETDPFEYTEDISIQVLGLRYEALPGFPAAGENGAFFIVGGGIVYVPFQYKYKEKSLSPSYATNINYTYKDSAVGYQFVLGGGFAAENGFEARVELPLLSFSFYTAGASGSVFVPTLTGSLGYRF